MPGTEAGRREISTGAGGDRTVELDRVAEAEVIAVLDRRAGEGERFSVLSEEIGSLDRGAPYPLVLVDPLDGSLNAKQGIPIYAVMLSLLDGPTVAAVRCGYVLNLVSGDEWTAVRGEGAHLNGRRLQVLRSQGEARIQLAGVESSPGSVLRCRRLLERAEKLRLLGSMALSVAHTAAGSFDVFAAPFPARIFDMTASLLLLQEAGGVASDIDGGSLAGKPVGLDRRSSLVVASSPSLHALALELLADRAG